MQHEHLRHWMDGLVRYVRSGEPDLSNRQMALLLTIYGTSGPHTVRGLAEKLRVSKPVVTRALNTLSSLGYLRRERDESDRRNVFIAQTDSGARFLERFEKVIGHIRPERSNGNGNARTLESATAA